jgi:hypothetical protein
MNSATITVVPYDTESPVVGGRWVNRLSAWCKGEVPQWESCDPDSITESSITAYKNQFTPLLEMPPDDSRGWQRTQPVDKRVTVSFPILKVGESVLIKGKTKKAIVDWYANFGEEVQVRRPINGGKYEKRIVTRLK